MFYQYCISSNYKNFSGYVLLCYAPWELAKIISRFHSENRPCCCSCCRGSPVDVGSLAAYLSGRTSSDVKLDKFPELIPCSVIHPDTKSCLVHNANAVKATFRKTFPLYFSLTFVPYVVLRLQKVLLYLTIFLLWPFTLHCFDKLSYWSETDELELKANSKLCVSILLIQW